MTDCYHFGIANTVNTDFGRTGSFGPQVGAIFDEYPEWRDLEPIAVTLQPGSASIHNGMIAHGAGPNMTPHPRRAMVCIYMPDDATYNGNQNVLSAEQTARLEVGDPLDDEDVTPLVWSSKQGPS